jgi:dTDP-4-dehydrorhamnose reductase
MVINEKILVLGGSGQIGTVAVKQLSRKFRIIAPTHFQLDVTNRNAVLKYLKKSKPDQILYIAGYTNTDGAREEAGKHFCLMPALFCISAILLQG